MTAQGPRYQRLSDHNYVSVDVRRLSELTRHKDGILTDRRVFHIPLMVQVGNQGHQYKVDLKVTASSLDTAMKAARVSAERFHSMDEGAFQNLYVKKTAGPQSFRVHKLGIDSIGMLRGNISGSDVDPNKVFSVSAQDLRRVETVAFNLGPACIGYMRTDKFFLRDVAALKKNVDTLSAKAENIDNIRRRAQRRIDQISDILSTGREGEAPISGARKKDYQEELRNLRKQVALVDSKLAGARRGLHTIVGQLNDLECFYSGFDGRMSRLESELKEARRELKRASASEEEVAGIKGRIEGILDQIRNCEDQIRSREHQLATIHKEHTKLESLVADMCGEKRQAPSKEKKPGFFANILNRFSGGSSGDDDYNYWRMRGMRS